MSITSAMILAAGRGERMMPLSRHLPKPLFEVAGETLISRHLARLSHAGIKTVVINVHYLADQIMAKLGTEQFGVEIRYSEEPDLLETAGGIHAALPLLGHAPFLVVNGDIYTDLSFGSLLKRVDVSKLPHLVMVPNPEHHPQGDFAVSDGKLLSASQGAALTYSGVGVYQAEFFADLPAGKKMLRPLFDRALDAEQLYGEVFNGLWSDVGTPERYEGLKAQVR